MRTFDTHCHLGGTELLPQASELARRAFDGGVAGMTLVAADEASLDTVPGLAKKLAQENPGMTVLFTAGVHPHDSSKIDDALWKKIDSAARTLNASAIGETGLDYHYSLSEHDVQRDFFKRHIELACELKKPLVIHCRDAADDVMKALDCQIVRQHPNPGILHCFTESIEIARRLLDLNFYISFSGIVSFRNAEPLREVARFVPLERMLIETDSPWLAPVPHRGKTNEPLFVNHVFETLTTLRQEPREQLADRLWENSCAVYGVEASS